jgi:hypothetical protein
MSIENQLKLAFRQSAQHLEQPFQLDAHIEQLFDKHIHGKGKSSKWFSHQNKFARIVIIAACFLIFSGFAYASTLIYHLNQDNVQIEATKDSQFNFTKKQLNEIIGARNEVRNNLAAGESAFVYIAELDKIKVPGFVDGSGMGLIIVTNPLPYLDLNQWKELTRSSFAAFRTPTLLPNGFAFNKGEIEDHFRIDSNEQTKFYGPLKEKALATDGIMAWEKAGPEDFLSHGITTPQLIYTNSANDRIEVNFTVKPPGIDNMNMIIPMGDLATAEKVRVADLEGYYSEDNQYIFNDTGYLKKIIWLEQVGDQTIICQVSSPSKDVSKEDLLLVANNFK